MSQNIEIEFKNMLSKEEYFMLIKLFHIQEEDFFLQENHYFDTPDFQIKENQSALRIRSKEGKYEMTLKQPVHEGLLETNQILSAEEALHAINDSRLPDGIVKDLLLQMDIPFAKIVYFGSLKTKRAEIHYNKGLLVFDHSYYLNQEDFELEYEVENFQDGQTVFKQFLQEYEIPQRKTLNKIRRFYQQKYRQMDSNK